MCVAWFLIGCVFGGIIGIFVIALLVAAKSKDE